jgi:hypothetical protein
MTLPAARRKAKRSFTLAPESVAFLREARRRLKARSDSEALDRLIHEAIVARRRKEMEAAFTAYYDSASDEELSEQRDWAHGTSGGMLAGLPE